MVAAVVVVAIRGAATVVMPALAAAGATARALIDSRRATTCNGVQRRAATMVMSAVTVAMVAWRCR